MENTMSPAQPETHSAVAPTIRYAGFWRRVVAWAIDCLVLVGLKAILMHQSGVHITASELFGPSFNQDFNLWFMMSFGFLYYAVGTSTKYQGTLGKMVIGLSITDLDGKRIGFLRACGRTLAMFVSAFVM